MIYEGCLLAEEIFTNEEFLGWVERQPVSVLDGDTRALYERFLAEKVN